MGGNNFVEAYLQELYVYTFIYEYIHIYKNSPNISKIFFRLPCLRLDITAVHVCTEINIFLVSICNTLPGQTCDSLYLYCPRHLQPPARNAQTKGFNASSFSFQNST